MQPSQLSPFSVLSVGHVQSRDDLISQGKEDGAATLNGRGRKKVWGGASLSNYYGVLPNHFNTTPFLYSVLGEEIGGSRSLLLPMSNCIFAFCMYEIRVEI